MIHTIIPDAFEYIKSICTTRLQELYPHGIPDIASKRLEAELQFLEHCEQLDDFVFFHELTKEAKRCCQSIAFRGSLSGSYLIYLLGDGRFNPLPVHYYCPKCGHFETVNTRLFGIDLPESNCPDCGSIMDSDGYNLSTYSVWGIDGKKHLSFDYNVSNDFIPFIKRVIDRLYPDYPIVPCGYMQYASAYIEPEKNTVEVVPGGYAILPQGNTMEDYADLITYLENGEPCLSGVYYDMELRNIKCIRLYPNKWMDYLSSLQRNTGIYMDEITPKEIRTLMPFDYINTRALGWFTKSLVSTYKPKTFFELVGFDSLSHSTLDSKQDSGSGRLDFDMRYYMNTPEFQEFPCYTREDFYDYLIEAGKSEQEAFQISELIRKGIASRQPKRWEPITIPAPLETLAQKILYLFPRAHSIEYMIIFAKLAYYMKSNSKVYSKVVFKDLQKNKA